MGALDIENFVTGPILLPPGAPAFALSCTFDGGWKALLYETGAGESMRSPSRMQVHLLLALPVLIEIMFVSGLYFRFA